MTGVCWALLTVYARTHPAGDTRQRLQATLNAKAPTPTAQRLAWMVTEKTGLIADGQLTESGKRAAIRFLPLAGFGAEALRAARELQ